MRSPLIENIEANQRRLAGELDRPIAALLAGLKQRGKVDDALALWGSEFGRTPAVEMGGDGKAKPGRGHNHYGLSVRPACGAAEELGFKAVDKHASVHDLRLTEAGGNAPHETIT